MRPDPLAAPAPRSAFTGGETLSGQRVNSSAGNFLLGPMPGSSPAAGALFIELPGPCRACWMSSGRLIADVSRRHDAYVDEFKAEAGDPLQ